MTHVPTVTAESDPPFVVARNPARMALKALGGAIILSIGLYMTRGGVTSQRYAPETVIAIGWAAAMFGAAVMIVVAVIIARSRPALIADRSGITLHSALGRATAVAWSDLAGWSVTRHKKENLLVLGMRDLDGYLRSLEGIRQVSAIRKAQRLGSPITVPLGDLMIDRATLSGRLNHWFETYVPVAGADTPDKSAS